MKTKIKKIWNYSKRHKKISITILIVCIIAIYGIVRNSGSTISETHYVFAKAQKSNVTISVTGSGQVSALDQIEIKSEVSGTIDYVATKEGDTVKKGQVIAHVENTDAKRSVSNAELSLTNAETAFSKAERTYKNQLGQSQTSPSDLEQSLDNGYTAVANAFIDLPKIFMDVSEIFYEPTNSPYFNDLSVRSAGGDLGIEYKYEAGRAFDSAQKEYDTVFKEYKNMPANPSKSQIVTLISDTHSLVKNLSSALNATHNTIDYLSDRIMTNVPNEITTDKNIISSYVSKTTGHMTKLSSSLTEIENAEDSATNAELSLKSAELSLNQAQDSLKDAKETLYNHTITAPFDGVISKIPVEADDKISNSASIATIITKAMKVSISLNEVDAAKIKVGDKAILTFDAIDNLSINGTVDRIDVVGTVNNGVVSYTADISFDGNDDRIKAGMTTNVSISTGSVSDVLAVSSAAISSHDGKSYVLVPVSATTEKSTADKSSLKEVEVQTGLSGDELTEITGGLSEGETYVSGTQTKTANDSSNSLLSLFGRKQTNTRSSSNTSTKTSTQSSSSSNSSATKSSNTGGFQNGSAPMPPQ
jgi:RND family efflux transporter MFP subunit